MSALAPAKYPSSHARARAIVGVSSVHDLVGRKPSPQPRFQTDEAFLGPGELERAQAFARIEREHVAHRCCENGA